MKKNIASQKTQKIFINNLNSWFSNFVIERLRTDHLIDAKIKSEFMGTLNETSFEPLPKYIEPKIIKFDYDISYKSEIFQNDVIIYNLNDSNLKELEYIIKGLKTIRLESEKIVILISNILTWSKTPTKYKLKDDDEGVVYEPIKDEEIEQEEAKVNEVNQNEDANANKELNNANPNPNINANINSYINDNVNETMAKNLNDLSMMIPDKKAQRSILFAKSKKTEEVVEDFSDKPILYYSENEYNKRIPDQRYIKFKYLENELLALQQKNNLKPYVICPGFIYGCGEDFFYDLYKYSFLGVDLPNIVQKKDTTIPTIHINDVISTIKRVIDRKPSIRYIIAIDDTKNRTFNSIYKSIKNMLSNKVDVPEIIINGISDMAVSKEEKNKKDDELPDTTKNINNNEQLNDQNNVENPEENENNQPNEVNNASQQENKNQNLNNSLTSSQNILVNNSNYMNIDLKLLPSKIFYDEKKENEDKEDFAKRSFPWHCQYGIKENLEKLRDEFITYRGLQRRIIYVLGAPYMGKTSISKILSKTYHIPIINKDDATEFIKNNLGPEDPLVVEMENKLNELSETLKEAEENYKKNSSKKKGEPPFDPSQHMKLPISIVNKILSKRIKEYNDCLLNGEVIDGYPMSYDDCKEYFCDKELVQNINENILEVPATNNKKKSGENIVPTKVKASESKVNVNQKGKEKIVEEKKEVYNYKLKNDKFILPSDAIFIIIDHSSLDDETILNRVKNSKEYNDADNTVKTTLIDKANRQLYYLRENEGEENFKSIEQFFVEYNIKYLKIDGKDEIRSNIQKINEYILTSNNGIKNINMEILDYEEYNKYNYEDECIKVDKILAEQNVDENQQPQGEEVKDNAEIDKKEVKNENLPNEEIKETNEEKIINKEDIGEDKKEEEIEEEEEEEEEIKDQMEIEKEKEFKLLEKKTEVLRRYISDNILPELSKAIIQVCQEMPDDPVEALANYLIENRFNKDEKPKNEKSAKNSSNSYGEKEKIPINSEILKNEKENSNSKTIDELKNNLIDSGNNNNNIKIEVGKEIDVDEENKDVNANANLPIENKFNNDDQDKESENINNNEINTEMLNELTDNKNTIEVLNSDSNNNFNQGKIFSEDDSLPANGEKNDEVIIKNEEGIPKMNYNLAELNNNSSGDENDKIEIPNNYNSNSSNENLGNL